MSLISASKLLSKNIAVVGKSTVCNTLKKETQIKEEYWNSEEKYWDSKDPALMKEDILLTTGGSDEYEIALRIINAIKGLNIKIKVIIGPGYRDSYIKEIEGSITEDIKLIYKPSSLKEYINSSRLVITAGGSTVYEVLCQRRIPVVFSIADNQDILCKTLGQMGLLYLGKYPNIDYPILKESIEVIKDECIRKYKKIFDIVDGKGSLETDSKITGGLG